MTQPAKKPRKRPPQWLLDKLRKCPRCNGGKRYRSGITGEIVDCVQCKGTGKVR